MPAGDVWGNSWASTWANSWAQAAVAAPEIARGGGGSGYPVPGPTIFWQNLKKRKPQIYDTATMFRSIEQTVYELVHPPTGVAPVRKKRGKALATQATPPSMESIDKAVAAQLARLAQATQGLPELDARLVTVKEELATLLAILEDDREVLMLI